MIHQTMLLLLLGVIFCTNVVDCLPPGGKEGGSRMPRIIEETSIGFQVSHSIIGLMYAAHAMNGNGIPKEVTNRILWINWLFKEKECILWQGYIDSLNNSMKSNQLLGTITMADVMSLTMVEKEDLQSIRITRLWSNNKIDIILDKKKIKAMPLYVKNKFKKDKKEQRTDNCICM